jgi:hypothetical protein
MRVELDIFSGRPNPSWELSAEEATELAKRLIPLSKAEEHSEEGGLGYRGFLISNPEAVAGIPSQIRVYQGAITISNNGIEQAYKDLNGIERWLIQQARKHGYENLVRGIIED